MAYFKSLESNKTVNVGFLRECWIMDTAKQIFGIQELYRPADGNAEVE